MMTSELQREADNIRRPLEDAGLTERFRYWGDWAGPNWSGSRYLNSDEPLDPNTIRSAPQDTLDSVARRHDIQYSKGALQQDPTARGQAARAADVEFMRNATLLEDKMTTAEEYAADAANIIFASKLLTGAGYAMPAINVANREKWLRYYDGELQAPIEAPVNTEKVTIDRDRAGGVMGGSVFL